MSARLRRLVQSLAMLAAACGGAVSCASESHAWIPGGVDLTDKVRLSAQDEGNLVRFDTGNGAVLVDSGTVHGDAGKVALPEAHAVGLRFVVRCHHCGVLAKVPGRWDLVCHARAAGETAPLAGAGGTDGTRLSFHTNMDLALGKHVVHCYHKGAAYSAGDCVVYFPDDQVLVVGNLVQPGRHAVIDPQGKTNLRGWARVLRELHRDFKDNQKLQVVPAAGSAGPASMLLDQAAYLEQVLDFAANAHRHGLKLEEMLEDVGHLAAKLKGRTGAPPRRLLELAYRVTGG